MVQRSFDLLTVFLSVGLSILAMAAELTLNDTYAPILFIAGGFLVAVGIWLRYTQYSWAKRVKSSSK